MLEKRFRVEIVTPTGVLVEEDVEGVKAPGVQGSFEVLAGHTPFLSLLEIGQVVLRDGGSSRVLATSGGVIEVLRTGVSLLIEAAEWAEDIDAERADQA